MEKSDKDIDLLVEEAKRRCEHKNAIVTPEPQPPILCRVFKAWGILNILLMALFFILWMCFLVKGEGTTKWFWASLASVAWGIICFGIAEFFAIIDQIKENTDAIRISLSKISMKK